MPRLLRGDGEQPQNITPHKFRSRRKPIPRSKRGDCTRQANPVSIPIIQVGQAKRNDENFGEPSAPSHGVRVVFGDIYLDEHREWIERYWFNYQGERRVCFLLP